MVSDSERRAGLRQTFHLLIYRSSGQAFEDLFTKIMGLANAEFKQVKPQGSIGDRKNDGFVKSTGRYYQVFAPESPDVSVSDAAEKAVGDFSGLVKYWGEISPVKHFTFCFNDKFKGTFPTIEANLASIERKHSVKCETLLAHQLEDILFGLDEDKILAVLGGIYHNDVDGEVTVPIVKQLIDDLIRNTKATDLSDVMDAPEFEQKLHFNGLTVGAASLIRTASYNTGLLEQIFDVTSGFAQRELQKAITAAYAEAREWTSTAFAPGNQADRTLYKMSDLLLPNPSGDQQRALFLIISFYFETCDVFERPTGDTNAAS